MSEFKRFGSGDTFVYIPIEPDEAEKLGALLNGCTVVALCGVDWNSDLSPWKARAVFRGQEDFSGGAPKYLQRLIEETIAQAECGLNVRNRIIAGYSMAGLFAVYAACQSRLFSGCASVSGSLWFEGFLDYLREAPQMPQYAYFSVGDRERFGRNRAFASIEDNTREAARICREKGSKTYFELNSGGHFADPIGRLAKGIRRVYQQYQ